jgi:hypothetical protein
MGLLLGAVACFLSDRLAWSGVLVGSACMAHQFGLLVAVPLAVLTLSERRYRFVAAAVVTVAVIGFASVALAGAGVLHALVGEGVAPNGTTWVDHLGLGNNGTVVVSRLVPLAGAGILAAVAAKRLGPSARVPIVLCSMLAAVLGLRLLFEENLNDYYLMAPAVMVVVVDWVAGRVRWLTAVWIVAISLIWPVSGRFNGAFIRDNFVAAQLLVLLGYFVLVAAPLVQAFRTESEGMAGPPNSSSVVKTADS